MSRWLNDDNRVSRERAQVTATLSLRSPPFLEWDQTGIADSR